jgi:hypothetical protein
MKCTGYPLYTPSVRYFPSDDPIQTDDGVAHQLKVPPESAALVAEGSEEKKTHEHT